MPSRGLAADAASDVLDRVRMRADLVCLSTFRAPWGIAFPDGPSHLHVVRRGEIWARPLAGGVPIRAKGGDLLLFPRGAGHAISDAPERAAIPLSALTPLYDPATLSMRLEGPGVESELMCCRFAFASDVADVLLRALPGVIHVPSEGRRPPETDGVVDLLMHEIGALRPASATVVSRLIEVLVVQTLRAWAEGHGRDLAWLAGIGDARVGRVLAAIHGDPARGWTTEEWASIAGLSRSAFVERFKRVVGDTPGAYLTRWRLSLAADLLAAGAPAASEVARRVGYASDAAFNRAFKARFSLPPAAFARRGG